MTPPAGFDVAFLDWLRSRTEESWREVEDWTIEDFRRAGLIGDRWRRGTRWTGGLSDADVDRVESEYGLVFPADHRLFLRTLHSTTPWRAGVGYGDNNDLAGYEEPGFYDWIHDGDHIRAALDRAYGGIEDIAESDWWPDEWGACPDTVDSRREKIRQLLAAAPRLIPIYAHRFLLTTAPPVVLSIHGLDIIIYGGSLRDYLLAELSDVLGVERRWAAGEFDIPFWEPFL